MAIKYKDDVIMAVSSPKPEYVFPPAHAGELSDWSNPYIWLSGSADNAAYDGAQCIVSPVAFKSKEGAKLDAKNLHNPDNQLILKVRLN